MMFTLINLVSARAFTFPAEITSLLSDDARLTNEKSATLVILMKTELVTTLKRHATEIISDLRKDKHPVLITQHGKPAAYLVDVGDFEKMQQRLSLLEGLAIGENAIREGRVKTQAEAKQHLARWLA